MHTSLKDLIQSIGCDLSKKIDDPTVSGRITKYLPFLNVSDTLYFFTIETTSALKDIDWLNNIYIHDYLFQTTPPDLDVAMILVGIKEDLLNTRFLPENGFISFSAINSDRNETIASIEIEGMESLTITLFDATMTIKDSDLLKQVKKKRDGTLEIKDENFTLSTDLELTQTTSGEFSFTLQDLDTYFAIADTGIIVSLESVEYEYGNNTHTLTLTDAGITLPAEFLKKAEKEDDDSPWQIKDEPVTLISDITLTQSSSSDFALSTEDISTSFAIGNTGFIVSVEKLILSTNDGFSFESATLVPPQILLDFLDEDNLTLSISDAIINGDGFSGRVLDESEHSKVIDGHTYTIEEIEFKFENNELTVANINAKIDEIEVTINVDTNTNPVSFELSIGNIPLHLEFPPLKRVTNNSGAYTIIDENFAIDLLIDLSNSNLSIETETTPICFSIADSGIIIEIQSLSIDHITEIDDYSILADSATMTLPEALFGTGQEIIMSDIEFSQNGFNGTVDIPNQDLTINILGIEGILTAFTIVNSIPEKIELTMEDDLEITLVGAYDPDATPAFSFSIEAGTTIDIPLTPLIAAEKDENNTNNTYSIQVDEDDKPIDFSITLSASASTNGNVNIEPEESDYIIFAIEVGSENYIFIDIEAGLYDQQLQVAKLKSAKVILPDLGDLNSLGLSLTHAKIDCQNAMFSGIVAMDLELTYNVDNKTLFGIPGGIEHVALTFKDNKLTGSDITGELLIPYFDQPAAIRINLQLTGNGLDFTISLKEVGEEEIELRKEELIALYIRSLELKKEGEIASFIINGGMEPLLMNSDGLEWPRLDVKNLTIEQDLEDINNPPILKFEEAWVDLKKLATVDLWGFHFELNRIGMGYEETGDKLWIDLTGNIKLMPQIPAGVEAKGFRITWPRDIKFSNTPPPLDEIMDVASKLEIKFDGIYLEYGVPGTVEFEGLIRFIKESQKVGFAGDMVLRVPATGLEIEAGLMIGMNFQAPPYPFLYMYFGIELPAGIPIAQSGLALKGAKGMFGLNVKPDKTPEQNWYYDWYKRGPIEGAHPTNKWTDARNAVAFGAGLTITTADGTLMGVRGLMVIALPGPFLMIEGTALVFDGVLPAAPLKALAIFDGAENTVQFNLAAEAEIVPDMLEAHGGLEAFFDFDDVTKWHLYLGENTPEERRIQANILKIGEDFLFNANAYLMIDMQDADTVRARLGAFIGFKPDIPKVGPVSVTADVNIMGEGATTINPVHFDGNLTLNAQLKASIAGVGIQANAYAEAKVEGPEPVIFDALLKASIELPFELADLESIPLPDNNITDFLNSVVEIPEIPPLEVEVKFHWESDENYVPASPLVDVSMENYFLQQAVTLDEKNEEPTPKSVLVSMDHRPVLVFDQDMNVDNSVNTQIVGTPGNTINSYKHSDAEYRPYLKSIVISKKSNYEEDWNIIASTSDDANPLYGVWRVDPSVENPEKTPKRNLKLWSTFPFANVYTGNDDSIVQQMLTTVEDVYLATECTEEQTSTDFTNGKIDEGDLGSTFSYENIQFEADSIVYANGELILSCDQDGSVKIIFSETILDLELELDNGDNNTIKSITTYQEIDTDDENNKFSVHTIDSHSISDYNGFIVVEIKTHDIKPFAVSSIRYTTQTDKMAYELCEEQNDKLGEMFPSLLSDSAPVLHADSNYKIEVQTKIDHNSGTEIPPIQSYVFHTEGPPNRLDRYIKYSHPRMEQNHIFLDDEFIIRFKRSWIKALYDPEETSGDNPYALDIYLKDAKGSFVPNVTMTWEKAESATLTPDEQKWYDYKESDPNTFTFPNDDEIRIVSAKWTGESIQEEILPSDFHIDEPTLRDNRPFHIDELITEGRRTHITNNNSRFFGSFMNRGIPRSRINNNPFSDRIKKKSEIISLHEGVSCSDSFKYEIFCKNQSSTDLFGLVFCYQNEENYYRFVVDIKNNSCKLERIIDTETEFTKTKEFDIKIKDIHTISVQRTRVDIKQNSKGYKDIHTIGVQRANARKECVFELKINNQSMIQHSERLLSHGKIGTIRSTHGTVVFNVLKPLSRYELILAGGNGGRSLYSSHAVEDEIKQLCPNPNNDEDACSKEIIEKSIVKLCTDTDDWQINATSITAPANNNSALFFDKLADKNIDLRVDFTQGDDHGIYVSVKRNQDKAIIDYIKVVLTDDNKLEIRKKNPNQMLPEARRTKSLATENRDFAVDLPLYLTTDTDDTLLGSIALTSAEETVFQTVRINIFNSIIKIFCQGEMIQINNSQNRSGEIGLFANNGGQRFENLSIREAEILKIPFMTSSFHSLRELLNSAQYYDHQCNGLSTIEAFTEFVKIYENFIKSQLEYEKSKIDLQNAIKNIGDVEESKSVFKNAKMQLDDNFATISPKSFYYEDPVDHVEIYRLIQNNKIQHLYLRSPEPLQLKYKIEGTSMTVGQVDLNIKDGLGNDIGYSYICSSCGNQALIMLDRSVDGNMTIEFYIQR